MLAGDPEKEKGEDAYLGTVSPTLRDWFSLFNDHADPLPFIPLGHSNYLLKGKDQSRVHLSASSGIKYPYQLVFSRIEHVPLPVIVSDAYLANGGKLECELRVSLFDLETASFFGKTWVSPQTIDVRTSKTIKSSQVVKNLDISKRNSTRRDSTKESIRKDSVIKSNEPADIAKAAGISFLNLEADSDEEMDDDDEEEEEGEDDDEEDEDEEDEEEEEELGGSITGHRVTLNLNHQCVYLHSPIKSPHVVAVVEFVFVVDKSLMLPNASKKKKIVESTEEERISGGWTLFYPFNPEKNGLKVDVIWNENADEEDVEDDDEQDEQKIVPVFNGSPRILPYVSSLLMSVLSGFPGLSPLPGSALTFRFMSRPDLRPFTSLWSENRFIGTGDDIPGIASLSLRNIVPRPSQLAYLSGISINVSPSIAIFEEKFLERIAKLHADENPESMNPDAYGHFTQPVVLERRLHVGFHNSFGFLGTPQVMSLQPATEDNIHETKWVFKGHLELDHYVPDEKFVVLVFVIEHKVQLKVNAPSDIKKKNALMALLERLSVSKPKVDDFGQITIDKFVCTGWGVWSPFDQDGKGISMPLHSGPLHNPYSTFVYSPILETFDDGEKVGPLPNKPFTLDFKFGDNSFPSPTVQVEQVTVKVDTLSLDMPPPRVQIKESPIQEDEELPEEELIAPPIKPNDDYAPFPLPAPSKLKSQISRIERARLLNAGFEFVLDENGQRPTQIQLGEGELDQLKWDLPTETSDPRSNEICATFMGVTFNEDFFNKMAERYPTSVYFSFQFYTFSYTTTEKLKVYTGPLPPKFENGRVRSSSVPPKSPHKRNMSVNSQMETRGHEGDVCWPGILYRYEKDGNPAYDRAPGCTIRYTVNSRDEFPSYNPRYGSTAFPRYLGQNFCHIDVWDADSFLHLGSSCVDLKGSLRQGRSAVYFEDDVDIVVNEFADDVVNPGLVSSGSSRSISSLGGSNGSLERKGRLSKIGTLHLRIANIGHTDKSLEAVGANSVSLSTGEVKEKVVESDYHDAITHRDVIVHEPRRLPEVDAELRAVLSETYKNRLDQRKSSETPVETSDAPMTDNERRLDRAQRLLEKENLKLDNRDPLDNMAGKPGSFVYQMTRQERERDLHTIDVYRERRKRELIADFLRQQITTKHTIHASFGQGYYFEYVFQNPYATDHNFEIFWDDDELRLVEDEAEWKYLRRVHNIKVGIESRVLSVKLDGSAEVFLRGDETFSIPFVYQSLLGGPVSQATPQLDEFAPSRGHFSEPGVSPRTISVSLLNAKKLPVAILDVLVQPTHFFVDRVIRLFKSESELVRKLVRFPIKPSGPGTPVFSYDSSSPNQKYVVCSNSEVVCGLSEATRSDSTMKELSFKVRVASAPDIHAIYFLFYHDPFHISLHEVWRVCVHSLYRFDANCVFGQTNPSSMVLRGPSISRNVMAHSNAPNDVIVAAPGPFALSANSLNEVYLLIRPKHIGQAESVLNIVDVDSHYLLSSWLVVSHSSAPPVTKTFDISIPVGKSTNKRVSYTNPFMHRKSLFLKTNKPEIMQFKESIIEMEGGATGFLGLRFMPSSSSQQIEILVFLNDEHDKTEECLAIRVSYL